MVISIVLAFLGRNTLNWFVDLTSFGAIVGFGYTCAAAWKIAKAEGNKKQAVLSVVGTVLFAFLIYTAIMYAPIGSEIVIPGGSSHVFRRKNL